VNKKGEIMALVPGPQMNAAVAEYVIGYKIWDDHRRITAYNGGPPIVVDGPNAKRYPDAEHHCAYAPALRYSTDIAAAWEVDKPNWWWIFIEHDDILVARIWDREESPGCDPNRPIAWIDEPWHEAGQAETYATARCKAALLAVMKEPK